jgi:diguanylate cyclase (GGDEF)-like protein
MISGGVAITAASLLLWQWSGGQVAAAVLLWLIASISQVLGVRYKAQLKDDKGATWYSPHLIFLFAAALALPAPYFVLVVIVTHLVDWVYERRFKNSTFLVDWYIQPFNMAVHIIGGTFAHHIFNHISEGPAIGLDFSILSIAAGAIAVLVYLFCNHIMVGMALVTARGLSWKQTGVFGLENLLSDLVLLLFGYSTGLLVAQNPLLSLPSGAMSIFIQRAMMVPNLKKEAMLDAKTGLLNAREFNLQLSAEFNRARRFGRPMSIIFADLDMFREVNNRYGHLAGDDVIGGIAAILRSSSRDYDLVGRFGGEEFVVAMPETLSGEAMGIAERIRQVVESRNIPAMATPLSR